MSNSLQTLKGFHDILPAEVGQWHTIERIAREVAESFNFCEIRTPILESSAVFHRGVGETNDMVRKETYTFTDRDGDGVTLRPEGTASAVRAVIEAGFLNDQGSRCKIYYIGANFRHERPQKGRLRQHHQFGVEAFGIPNPEQDVECILLQMEFYKRCGVKDLQLNINSMGDRESKQRYRDTLVAFLTPKSSTLSEDSQRRLDSNPLRILDSKDKRDIEACSGIPPAYESLSEVSKKHFERVEQLLTEAGAKYTLTPALVRGFDYYTETLWEVTAGGLGAQNAIGGGGRYDNLVEMMGGRPTPGVGFGSGLERLLLALGEQKVTVPITQKPLIWLCAHGEAARNHNITLIQELRQAGLRADMDLSGRAMKAQLKLADKEKASFSLITGEDEIASCNVLLKNFTTKEQISIPRNQIISKMLEIAR